MKVEQERNTIIHVIYIAMVLFLLYGFFHTVLYAIFPFLLGFLIAFSLRPMIRHTIRLFHLPAKLVSLFYLILFYGTIGFTITVLLFQCFQFLKDFLQQLPSLYELQIAPAFYACILRIQELFEQLDPKILQLIQDGILQFSDSLNDLALRLSSNLIPIVSNLATSLPSILIAFFFTILSSIFFTLDFSNIAHFFMRQFSSDHRSTIYILRTIIIETIQCYIFAYGKMMLITFLELAIGLSYLQVSGAISIALCISIFDIFPILGTGMIIYPWAIISFFNHRPKFALGLLILHLIINLIRQVVEPKIVGKQMGLHPLLMLACMFFGIQLFGFMGIFLAPILLQIVCRMNEEGLLHLYK